jgi:CheY-like chemotaxis protein
MVASAAATGDRAKAFRVLVVDDNRDAADSLALLLKAWGYDSRVAYDGAAGLEAALAYRPDCLLLDIGLPRLDGYAVARQVRQQPGLERAKLVALTAYSDETHARRARESGFDFYLVKPADPSEVGRVLEMFENVMVLAGKAEELGRQNVALATETKELLKEVKEDLRAVKEEVRELKAELREVTEDKADGRQGSNGP